MNNASSIAYSVNTSPFSFPVHCVIHLYTSTYFIILFGKFKSIPDNNQAPGNWICRAYLISVNTPELNALEQKSTAKEVWAMWVQRSLSRLKNITHIPAQSSESTLLSENITAIATTSITKAICAIAAATTHANRTNTSQTNCTRIDFPTKSSAVSSANTYEETGPPGATSAFTTAITSKTLVSTDR